MEEMPLIGLSLKQIPWAGDAILVPTLLAWMRQLLRAVRLESPQSIVLMHQLLLILLLTIEELVAIVVKWMRTLLLQLHFHLLLSIRLLLSKSLGLNHISLNMLLGYHLVISNRERVLILLGKRLL